MYFGCLQKNMLEMVEKEGKSVSCSCASFLLRNLDLGTQTGLRLFVDLFRTGVTLERYSSGKI